MNTRQIVPLLVAVVLVGFATACAASVPPALKATEPASILTVNVGGSQRHEEALRAAEKAISLKRDDAAAWTNKGAALLNLGRLEESVKASAEAVRLKHDIPLAWYNVAGALGRLGRHEEAVEAADEAIGLQPANAWNWVNKAGSLLALGRFQEALEASDEVIRLQPDNVYGWNHKGLSLANVGRGDEAKLWLCRAWGMRDQLGDKGGNAERTLRTLGASTDRCATLSPSTAR